MKYFIKEGKTNWAYVFIVFSVAAVTAGGILFFSQNSKFNRENFGEELSYNSSSQELPKMTVKLFYYNEVEDRKLTPDGSLACSQKAILPVEREIPETETPIEDAVNLLIRGELTTEEKEAGFVTEFPNPNFKLLSLTLDEDKVMTARFTEVPGFTTGGACRTDLLAMQIVKTVFQFPGINQVSFSPLSLFQP